MMMKFSEGHVTANTVDPDQTSPRGAVWSGSTLFVILSVFFRVALLIIELL